MKLDIMDTVYLAFKRLRKEDFMLKAWPCDTV
jgi:hypothetical protein